MASRGGGGGGGGGGGHGQLLICRERSASFHGRSSSTTAAGSEPRLQMMRRPKTHPDLLGPGSGVRLYSSSAAAVSSSSSTDDERRRRVPAKVVVNVTVQRSLLGPLQVMASTEWTVEKLVEEALKQYRKEGRRPLLITTTTTTTTTVLDPSAFGLHYSQFTLQSLDPKEKLIGLGSRNFFLCPKQKQPPSPAAAAAAADTDTAAAAAPTSSSSSCSGEAHDKTSKITIPWLRFMDFLL